jgi:hypothetical protein
MELTYKEKIIKLLGHELYLKPNKAPKHFFHLDCKISKKKFCTCSLYKVEKHNTQLSNLIDIVSSDDFSIDLLEKKVYYSPKKDYSAYKVQVLEEMIDKAKFNSINELLSEFEGQTLTKYDYRDICKAMKSEIKVCETCKILLVENNYHKGWKNPDTGESVLLCNSCLKNYQAGNLETSSVYSNLNSSIGLNLNKKDDMSYGNYSSISSSTQDGYSKPYNNYSNYNNYSHREVNSSSTTQNKPFQTFSTTTSNNINTANNANSLLNTNSTTLDKTKGENNYVRPNFQVISHASKDNITQISQQQLLGMKRDINPIVIKPTETNCYNSKCNRIGKKQDMLNCKSCQKYYHPQCVNPSIVLRYAARFEWYCEECKVCEICSSPSSIEAVIKCDYCDRVKHLSCAGIYNESTSKSYYCQDCVQCKNCLRPCPMVSNMNVSEPIFMKGFRVCNDCWKSYKTQNYCPKCVKVYTNQSDFNTVYCRKCLCNFHIECERISVEELNSILRNKVNYTCSICKQESRK